MTIAVLDASVAIKFFVPEEDSGLAENLMRSKLAFHAPELLRIEFANTCWKMAVKGRISASVHGAASLELEQMIAKWHGSHDYLARALARAGAANHPIYDFIYLELAKSLGALLITADKKFAAKAGDGSVVLLQDWTA